MYLPLLFLHIIEAQILTEKSEDMIQEFEMSVY